MRSTSRPPVAADVEVRRLEEQPVASSVIPGIGPDAVGAALHGILPDVFSHLEASGVPMLGAPFARYHPGRTAGTFDLEAGIPVGGDFAETDTIKRRTLPGGDVLTVTHVGSYDGLPTTLASFAAWREANGRTAAGPYWEVYVDDPSTVPADQVRTELFEPLAPKR
jgi:effector-binding domain-containing protein